MLLNEKNGMRKGFKGRFGVFLDLAANIGTKQKEKGAK